MRHQDSFDEEWDTARQSVTKSDWTLSLILSLLMLPCEIRHHGIFKKVPKCYNQSLVLDFDYIRSVIIVLDELVTLISSVDYKTMLNNMCCVCI